MDPAGGPVLHVLFVEPAVLPEVLAKVQEDTAATLLDVDIVPTDGCGTVIHRNGGHGGLWIYLWMELSSSYIDLRTCPLRRIILVEKIMKSKRC